MFPRPSFVLLLCLVVNINLSSSKPQNSSAKPVDKPYSQAGQSFVVNNNCGLGKTEREMMAYIKAKVDYIAKQSDKESACSNGWVAYGKSCFLVIDIPKLEWSAARRNCQKLGGDLAKITSAAEDQFIYNLISKQSKTTVWGAWLGLHRKADTKFYWTDGSPLAGYSAWNTGEPNGPSTEKCGQMHGPSHAAKGTWNDIWCSVNKAHITMAPVVLCQKSSK